MCTHQDVKIDERTVAVENTSNRWALTFVIFALLIDVMYRGAVRNEVAWDLMALAIVPGIVTLMYGARQKTLVQGWFWKLTLLAFVAGVIAAAAAVVLAMTKAM